MQYRHAVECPKHIVLRQRGRQPRSARARPSTTERGGYGSKGARGRSLRGIGPLARPRRRIDAVVPVRPRRRGDRPRRHRVLVCEDLAVEVERMGFAHVTEIGLLRVFDVGDDRRCLVPQQSPIGLCEPFVILHLACSALTTESLTLGFV